MPRKKIKQHNTRKDLQYKASGRSKKIKRKNTEKEVIQYKGLPCDSYPEKYTLMWLFELEEAGFIVEGSIQRSESYLLFNTVSRNWVERLKTKSNPRVETLLAAHLYTPDFVFTLTAKGKSCGLFSDIDGDCRLRKRNGFNLIHQKGVVHIETKGKSFRTANDTLEKFSVDRKWVWEKHQVYVNLFICDQVFPKTWTPSDYRVTDKTLKPRKINWAVRNLNSYLKML
jgi:hypothetical protein